MIKIIGLGTQAGDVSLRGLAAVQKADRAIAKTAKTAGFVDVAAYCKETTDDLYESSAGYDEYNAAVVARLRACEGDTVFCVPGDGCTDSCVAALAQAGLIEELIPAAGPVQAALAKRPATSFTAVSAYEAETLHALDTDLPLIVYDIDDAAIAGDVKLKLYDFYGDESPVWTESGWTTLSDTDRQDRISAFLLIPPGSLTEKAKYTFGDLVKIMEILTGENGCPWDRAQTHESVRANLVEEAFEAVEAIDTGDVENLMEEMGDLLLQAMLHSAIAKKEEEFDSTEMIDRLCKKLVFRHPHVFGSHRAKDADGALSSWEAAKAVEKSQETLYDKLVAIPAVFPQSLRAVKVGKRAVKAGIGADLNAEDYARMAIERIGGAAKGQENAERTLGEALYSVCSLARVRGVDPEIAMKKVIDGYVERFRQVEETLAACGKKLSEASEEEVQRALVKAVYRENRGR